MHVALTAKSSNVKIGAIPCTTSSRKTCPPACPLQGDGGCYAEAGFHTRMHWDKVTDEVRGTNYTDFLAAIQNLQPGQLWRHNVAGDLQPDSGKPDTIDAAALAALTQANTGKRGFTYTHYPDTTENIKAIRAANAGGFTVNLSANSLPHAVELFKRHGLPVATIAPEDHGTETREIDGVRFVTCPATYREDTTCKTCRLCAVADRKVVVVFPAHGTRAKQVNVIARG